MRAEGRIYFCNDFDVTVVHTINAKETERMGLNMRTFQGDVDGIKVYFEDGWTEMEPQYKV